MRIVTAIGSTLLMLAAFIYGAEQTEPVPTRDKQPKTLTRMEITHRLGAGGDIKGLIDFYFSASHRTDIDVVLSNLTEEFTKKGYVLKATPDDSSICIGSERYKLGKYKTACHLASSDGNIWLDLVICSSGECFKANLDQRFTGGGSFANPNKSWWTFYTLKESEDNAVAAYFRAESLIVNIGISLPIAIPSDKSKQTQSDLRYINARIDTLYDVTRSVVQHLASEEDLIMMPLPPGEELTAAQRVIGFVQFWSEVKYNFAFFDQVPELDWDRVLYEYLPEVMPEQTNVEYYRLMQRVCALLKDGHTNIQLPANLKKFSDKPMIELRNVGRRAIVMNVGKSLEDIIPLGSEIVAVNGVPTEEYLQNEIFPYISSSTDHLFWDWGIRDLLKGPRDTEIKIKFRNLQGKSSELNVARNSKTLSEEWIHRDNLQWKRFEFKWLEDEIAYVALNSFVDKGIVEDFQDHLSEICKSKGLILDIRKNGGGNSSIGWDILTNLTDHSFAGLTWKTPEHRSVYKAWGQNYSKITPQQLSDKSEEDQEWIKKSIAYYQGKMWYESEPHIIEPDQGDKITVPVVVLTGHVTGSAAEDFLIAMDSIQRATFVGQKTGGSTGQPLKFNLPGGGSARVCTVKATYPDGREFVGYGISPHVYIEPTVEDILNDRDIVLEKGIEVLKEKMAEKGTAIKLG